MAQVKTELMKYIKPSLLSLALTWPAISIATANADLSVTKSDDVVKVQKVNKQQSAFLKEFGSLDSFLNNAKLRLNSDPNWVLNGATGFLENQESTFTSAENFTLQFLKIESLVNLYRYKQASVLLDGLLQEIESISVAEQLKLYTLSVAVGEALNDVSKVVSSFEAADALIHRQDTQLAVSSYDKVSWLLNQYKFYVGVQDFPLAKLKLLEAKDLALASNNNALNLWVLELAPLVYIEEQSNFLASQAYQELEKALKATKLTLAIYENKLKWAKLKLKQKQYAQAERLTEASYQYANKTRNRALQLSSALILLDVQLAKLDLAYAKDLYNGIKQLKELPNALGRNEAQRQLVQNKIALAGAKLAYYDGQLATANRLINEVLSEKVASSYANMTPLMQLTDQALALHSDVLKAEKRWLEAHQVERLREFRWQQASDYIQRRTNAYKQYVQSHQAQQLQQQISGLQAVNTDLSNALLFLTEKLQTTRWILLILIFCLVLFVYHAILRRQNESQVKWGRLNLLDAKQQIEMRLEQGQPFSLIAIDFNDILQLNIKYGIDKVDQSVQASLQGVQKLNQHYQIINVYGHRYWLIAPGYDEAQAQTLVTRIEKEINNSDVLHEARYEVCEVNSQSRFAELYEQLETNLAK